MSFQHYHWRRNNRCDHEGAHELVHGSPVQHMKTWVDNAPANSPLSMLMGFQDSILPLILSFTEYAVVPCTCCSQKPVVFCCRRQQRVLRDLTKRTTLPPPSKSVDLAQHCSEFCWLWEDLSVLVVSCGPTHGTPGPWHEQTEEAYAADQVRYACASYLAITETGIYSREMGLEWDGIADACFGVSKFRKLLHIGSLRTNKEDGSTRYSGFIFFIDSTVLTKKIYRLLKRAKRVKMKHQANNDIRFHLGQGPVLREEKHLANML